MTEKKKETKKETPKSLTLVHAETLALLSKELNQAGIDWENDEDWEDLAKKCEDAKPKLAETLRENRRLMVSQEVLQSFNVDSFTP